MWRACIAALLLAAVAVPGAQAIHQVKSLYTVVDLGACKEVTSVTRNDARVCEGLPGYPVYVVEDARKVYLSVRLQRCRIAGGAADALRRQHRVRAGDQAHDGRMAIYHP